MIIAVDFHRFVQTRGLCENRIPVTMQSLATVIHARLRVRQDLNVGVVPPDRIVNFMPLAEFAQ